MQGRIEWTLSPVPTSQPLDDCQIWWHWSWVDNLQITGSADGWGSRRHQCCRKWQHLLVYREPACARLGRGERTATGQSSSRGYERPVATTRRLWNCTEPAVDMFSPVASANRVGRRLRAEYSACWLRDSLEPAHRWPGQRARPGLVVLDSANALLPRSYVVRRCRRDF